MHLVAFIIRIYHDARSPERQIGQIGPDLKQQYTKYHAGKFFSVNHRHTRQSLVQLGLLIIEAPRQHSDTAHSEGLLWKSDQTFAENSDNTRHSQGTVFA